jgi:hypothetical protein
MGEMTPSERGIRKYESGDLPTSVSMVVSSDSAYLSSGPPRELSTTGRQDEKKLKTTTNTGARSQSSGCEPRRVQTQLERVVNVQTIGLKEQAK